MRKEFINEEKVIEIVEKVKRELRPSREEYEEAFRFFRRIKELVNEALSPLNYEFKVSLEGSLAKDTCIRGEIDLDIFLLIRYEGISNEWIEKEILKPIVKRVSREKDLRIVKRYASHPYLELYYRNLRADLVPAYWARSIPEIKTAVDRTPFHTEYIKLKLNRDELRDEVRLLKKFMKGIGVYGAEIKVEGFSGYLCELLIVKYGSFINTLRNALNWKPRTVIVIEGDYRREELLKLFPKSPLIVPDPVDPRRNAAASVSLGSLSKFVLASRTFLRRPSTIFFYPKRISLSLGRLTEIVKQTERDIFFLEYIIEKSLSPDILWGELKSIARRLNNILTSQGFNVIDVRVWSDEEEVALIALDIMNPKLPSYTLHRGPPINKPIDSERFIDKYVEDLSVIGPWIHDDGRLYVIKRRKYTMVY
ncbi:MAG TPA: CCA tRNA nucleotidyltransferase, partial [Acidilobales archaeon]|nr:CCA tRNA nucleotidyltransferase [Acidilobales archaeon]